MKKLGKISPIKKEIRSSVQTMQTELSKKGMSRIPGTGVFKYPYKEISGRYRTGLDPDATYIQRISDNTERELEIEKVTKLRNELQTILGIDLSPTSKYWNSKLATDPEDNAFVKPIKLLDQDNLFDLSSPWQALAFAWLRVHPTIASSYQAWERGQYPADTQFYVADEEIENAVLFKKKQLINNAIVKFQDMSPEKRKKVARLMGLPISDDMKEEVVYNLVDNIFKQTEYKTGQYQGLTPVEVFTKFSEMNDNLLTIKDLIKQAITHSVYRVKPNGKIFKGEFQVAETEEELAKYLANDDNQEDLLLLERELKTKKLMEV